MTEPRTSRLLDEHGNPRKHLSGRARLDQPQHRHGRAHHGRDWHAFGDEGLEVSKQGLYKLGLNRRVHARGGPRPQGASPPTGAASRST